MANTLNVKLRYEQVIKNLLENDEKNEKQTVRQIIKNTKPAKMVVLTKTLDEPERKNTTPVKMDVSSKIRSVSTSPKSLTPQENPNLARLFKGSEI